MSVQTGRFTRDDLQEFDHLRERLARGLHYEEQRLQNLREQLFDKCSETIEKSWMNPDPHFITLWRTDDGPVLVLRLANKYTARVRENSVTIHHYEDAVAARGVGPFGHLPRPYHEMKNGVLEDHYCHDPKHGEWVAEISKLCPQVTEFMNLFGEIPNDI